MMSFRRFESRLIRCAVTALALFAFVVAAFPVPLPVAPVASSAAGDDEPYPCQGGRCGCQSAKQCWTACCCRKPSERKRWAEEHRVRPPAYAILHDSDGPAPRSRTATSGSRSCCAASAVSEPAEAPSAARSCCTPSGAIKVNVASETTREIDYVLSIRAMECRGLGHDLSSIAWFYWVPVVPPVRELDFETLVFLPHDDWADSSSLDLDTPPPRCG